MQYICHRINRSSRLAGIPDSFGAEIDLRDTPEGRLYLEHDPFTPGEDFEEYIRHYHHGILILNVKSERIEERVLDIIKAAGVQRYFFLDSSFPMIHLLSQKGVADIAIRFSEFEGLDTIRAMAGRVRWVWADCFTQCVLTPENYSLLRSLGYNICVVSPELQGRPEDIEKHAEYLKRNKISPDAVCTKQHNIPVWEKYFE